MSKFNVKKETRNLAGGKAYAESKEMQLLSLLLTSFMNDKYYQGSGDIEKKLHELIDSCDKLFCAKAIVYARREFGLRSVSHVAASIIAKYISGEKWAKNFYDKVIFRPDDITEIMAYHFSKKQKLSNAMKRGFAKAFSRFDEYQLAKYKGQNNQVKLVDAVNLVHPNKCSGVEKLVSGTLKCTETWGSMLSGAKGDYKENVSVWKGLLSDNKLGYMALLRNVRNILILNDDNLSQMCFDALVNEKAIHKSLVLPFRFITAYEQLESVSSDAMTYISRACEIACDNIPKFEGRTLIALDTSGSMMSVCKIASLFAAALMKSNNCDIVTFDYSAKYRNINRNDSIVTIQKSLCFAGGYTNFPSIFEVANKKYDRIIILSDMQSWMRVFSPKKAFEQYKKDYGIDSCKVYSIDLSGYGTLQLPEKDIFCLAGFSEKIFDLMKLMEQGVDALFDKIDEIDLN